MYPKYKMYKKPEYPTIKEVNNFESNFPQKANIFNEYFAGQ